MSYCVCSLMNAENKVIRISFSSEEHMKSAEYRKPQLTVDTDYLRWNPQTKRNRTSSHKKHWAKSVPHLLCISIHVVRRIYSVSYPKLTLGVHVQEGYCSWVCVCVHLTSGASVCPENSITYSADNEGQKIVGISLKLLRCRHPAAGWRQSAIFQRKARITL